MDVNLYFSSQYALTILDFADPHLRAAFFGGKKRETLARMGTRRGAIHRS
jgi:hypothetical protein